MSRLHFYLSNQARYRQAETTIGIAASNRYNYDLERRSNGSWGCCLGGSKKRGIRMTGNGFEYITTASEDDEKWTGPVDSRPQLDVIIRSRRILIVVGGSPSGG